MGTGATMPGFGSGSIPSAGSGFGGGGAYGGGGSFAPSAPAPQAASSSGEYEARLLEDVCAPGGARAAPPQVALDSFCKKCEALDSQRVGKALAEKIAGEHEWQVKLKALYVIE